MIKDAIELARMFAPKKAKRRAALAESLLMQFISSAQPVAGDPTKAALEPSQYQVFISAEMMRNLKQWQRAKRANFKGAAGSVLKGGF